jgi:stage II sporulation protein D
MRRWASALAPALLLAGCVSSTTVAERVPPGYRPPGDRRPDTATVVLETRDPVRRRPAAGGAVSADAAAIRVGLSVDAARLEVGSSQGLLVTAADGREVGRGSSAAFEATRGGDVAVRVGGGGLDELPAPLVVRPERGGVLRIGEKEYRGEMLVQEGTGGGLTLVNRLDVESYLLGVVPREIGPVGPRAIEAAKAQAVAARTFAVRHRGRRDALGFDVFATTADQVYGGASAESDAITDAVLDTEGEILTFGGQPIDAFYHSTCGGRTAAIDEVWPARPVPYLVSVEDVDPATGLAWDRASSRFRWTERWTGAELVSVFARTLADSLRGRPTVVRDVRIVDRTPSGRVRRMLVSTDAGEATIGRDRVRWLLTTAGGAPLNSALFDVTVQRDRAGNVASLTAEGSGWGHGIGMCQVGAIGRAQAGQDYRTILRAYYRGAEITDLY